MTNRQADITPATAQAGRADPSVPGPENQPKYLWLREEVMDIIESLPRGAAIPSERELSSRLGSSQNDTPSSARRA